MTEVDLDCVDAREALDILEWLLERYGDIEQGRWNLKDLRYIQFAKDSDATFFSLYWSQR